MACLPVSDLLLGVPGVLGEKLHILVAQDHVRISRTCAAHFGVSALVLLWFSWGFLWFWLVWIGSESKLSIQIRVDWWAMEMNRMKTQGKHFVHSKHHGRCLHTVNFTVFTVKFLWLSLTFSLLSSNVNFGTVGSIPKKRQRKKLKGFNLNPKWWNRYTSSTHTKSV